MPLYQDVIELNNKGVAAIHLGDPKFSLSMLRGALRITQELATKSAVSIPSTITTDEDDHVRNMGLGGLESPAIVECAFLQAVNLTPSHAAAYAQDPVVTLALTFALVEFNQAIVHHLYGLQEDEKTFFSTVSLARAQTCYFKAQEVLAKIGIPYAESSYGYALIDFLTLVTHFNLAQISSFMSHHEASKQHFQSLALYAATIQPDFYDSATATVLNWLTQAFLSYMHQVLQLPESAAAA
jgi:hypothetical protein